MHHSFLIHSSANGHLGGFHVLAIVNSAVMNIGLHMSLSILRTQISYVSPALADGFFTTSTTWEAPTIKWLLSSKSSQNFLLVSWQFSPQAWHMGHSASWPQWTSEHLLPPGLCLPIPSAYDAPFTSLPVKTLTVHQDPTQMLSSLCGSRWCPLLLRSKVLCLSQVLSKTLLCTLMMHICKKVLWGHIFLDFSKSVCVCVCVL